MKLPGAASALRLLAPWVELHLELPLELHLDWSLELHSELRS